MSARIAVQSVEKIFSDSNHNAFTDLCRFNDEYYLTFRSCPDGHMIYASSKIVVFSSTDTVSWNKRFEFSAPERDVRDPHFLVFGDTLFVYSGTWPTQEGNRNFRDMGNHLGYCGWTRNGEEWHGPVAMESTRGFYIWRAATNGTMAYLNGRRVKPGTKTVANSSLELDIEGCLLCSEDGLEWRLAAQLPGSSGNETAFLFEDDGEILALARGWQEEHAHVLSAKPPFLEWRETKLDRQIGGPLLAKWHDVYIAAGRETRAPGDRITALYLLEGSNLVKIGDLPSGGDSSYPGFVATDERSALLSFYSSHEGSGTNLAPSSIYLARLTYEGVTS